MLVRFFAGQLIKRTLPKHRRGASASSRQDLMSQDQGAKLPDISLIAYLDAQEIEQDVEILPVVGQRRRGVVVFVFLVVLDNGLQDVLQAGDGGVALNVLS